MCAQVELSPAQNPQGSLDPCLRHVRGSLFLARQRQQLPAMTDDGSVLNEERTDGGTVRRHTEGTHTDGSRHRPTGPLPAPHSFTHPFSHQQHLSSAQKKKEETRKKPRNQDKQHDAFHRINSLKIVALSRVMHPAGGCARIFLLFAASGSNFSRRLQQLPIAGPGLVVSLLR